MPFSKPDKKRIPADMDGKLKPLDFRISSREDLKRVVKPDIAWMNSRFALLDDYARAVHGQDTSLFVLLGAFFTSAYDTLFGFENFMYHLFDDLPLIEDVLEIGANYYVEMTRKIVEKDLVGNLDVGGSLSCGTADDVRCDSRALIDTIGRDGGLVLASSHSITRNVKPENFMAMVKTAQTYGQYR